MRIEIDLQELESLDITASEYFYMYLINNGLDTSTDTYKLQDLGYIKFIPGAVVLREKGLKLFKDKVPKSVNLEPFCDQYRELFPQKVKTFGRPVKGDRRAIIDKMTRFFKRYDFTQEEVLEATRIYLKGKERLLWDGTQCADYFIEKDKVSTLATCCEELRNSDNKVDNSKNLGQSEDI